MIDKKVRIDTTREPGCVRRVEEASAWFRILDVADWRCCEDASSVLLGEIQGDTGEFETSAS